MNKILRVFLVVLLSFQLVVSADGGLGSFYRGYGNSASDSSQTPGTKIGQAVSDAGGKVIGFIANAAGVVVDASGYVIGTLIDGILIEGDSFGYSLGEYFYGRLGDKNAKSKGGAAQQNTEKDGKSGAKEDPKVDQPKQDAPKVDNPQKDAPNNDNPKDNKSTDNNKKKDDGPDPFDILIKVVKGISGLYASDKIDDVLTVLKRIKQVCEAVETIADIKDKIESLVNRFKDEVNDSDMTDEEKEILCICVDEMKLVLEHGGENMDEQLTNIVNNTNKILAKEEVKKETEDKNKDKDKDKDKDNDKNNDKDKNKDNKDKDNNNNDVNGDDKIDKLLDAINDESKPQKEREDAAHELANELEKKGYDKDIVAEADALVEKINDGITDLADELLDLAKDIAISKASEKLEQFIGKENAAAIEEYAKKIANGEMDLAEALEDGLEKVIDEYLPPNTAEGVKEFITSIAEGEGINAIRDSLLETAENAAKDALSGLLAKTGLSEDQQKQVMEAAEAALDGDWTKAWDSVKGGASDFLGGLVEDKFGKEAGAKAKDAITDLLNGDFNNFLDKGLDTLTTIASSELEKRIDGVLNSLSQKYPILGQVFDALGLNGGSVMGALTNCWNALKDGDLSGFMTDLVSKITEKLNDLAKKLMDFAKNFLSNLMNTVGDFINDALNSLFDTLSSAVKAALDGFVNAITGLKETIANASSYFLGNEKGSGATLIEMKNQLNNILQKNVFKAGDGK